MEHINNLYKTIDLWKRDSQIISKTNKIVRNIYGTQFTINHMMLIGYRIYLDDKNITKQVIDNDLVLLNRYKESKEVNKEPKEEPEIAEDKPIFLNGVITDYIANTFDSFLQSALDIIYELIQEELDKLSVKEYRRRCAASESCDLSFDDKNYTLKATYYFDRSNYMEYKLYDMNEQIVKEGTEYYD